jgi:NRPS condensation-like uncharacterized protein
MTEAGASIQARLEIAEARPPAGGQLADSELFDPVGLFRRLETSGRFHRDSGLGRMFHPGSVSLRENRPSDSLHIVIRHNRVAAHIDRVSPLRLHPARPPRYSLRRAVAHNLAGMTEDAVRLLRGRQGDHRSELACRWDPTAPGHDERHLLDPAVSAWSLHLEARVTGTLEETRLRRALDQVLGDRPADHDVLQVADCPDDDHLGVVRAELQAAPVRVTEWPPWRARLARRPDGDILMLNVNHAASDGFGALSVLRAIARAYAGEADLDPIPDFLAVRDLPVHPASDPEAPFTAWSRAALERVRDLLARPAQLAPDQAGDDPGYGFHLVRLSSDETRRIIDAGHPGTSRNVLLAALHLAIRDWNRLHGTPVHRIGVLVQVNLRPPEWPDQTIGNFSVTARVSTSRRHRTDGASALAAITAQTTRNKRTRSGIALVAGLDRSGLLALWAKQSLIVLQPLTRNRLIDTAMVGNLGLLDDPPSFGTEVGETLDVWFSAPSRAPRSLCIGAVTVAGRLHLVVRYPHRVFGPDAVRRFADCYRAQLLVVAAGRPVGP